MQPGRLLPWYSSSTETNAQSCRLIPWSFRESNENRSSTLQNQILSILSWNPPLSMPGGRTNTRSWRFDFCSVLPLKGQQATRCSPAYILCPMRRVENSLRCPSSLADCSNCSVSRRPLTWEYAEYEIYMHIHAHYAYTCSICIYMQMNRDFWTCWGPRRPWIDCSLGSSGISGRLWLV